MPGLHSEFQASQGYAERPTKNQNSPKIDKTLLMHSGVGSVTVSLRDVYVERY